MCCGLSIWLTKWLFVLLLREMSPDKNVEILNAISVMYMVNSQSMLSGDAQFFVHFIFHGMSLSPHIFHFSKATNLVLVNKLTWMLYSLIPMTLYHHGDMPCLKIHRNIQKEPIGHLMHIFAVSFSLFENFLKCLQRKKKHTRWSTKYCREARDVPKSEYFRKGKQKFYLYNLFQDAIALATAVPYFGGW